MNKRKLISLILSLTLTVGILSGCGSGTNSSTSKSDSVEITNVSYDPTRELYEEYMMYLQIIGKKKLDKM